MVVCSARGLCLGLVRKGFGPMIALFLDALSLLTGVAPQDDVIDMIEGNRKYIRCLYAYNKVR
jgi:hypothetical protein